MKRTLLVLLVAAFVITGVVVPACTATDYFGRSMFTTGHTRPGCPPTPELAVFEEEAEGDPSGEAIIFDAVIMRPLSLASIVLGVAGTVVSAPWAETSCSWDRVHRQLLMKPYMYTFCRPLGDILDE
ncbi:MAG: hypothetical protein AB9873_03730 [Syntrophobacteraceae bacterium]